MSFTNVFYNDNKTNPRHFFNEQYCHAELVSASQNDTVFSCFTSHFSCKSNPSQPSLRKGMRKWGFTLAEVLITLGIIGVVAAITMPTIVQNQQKRSLEVATQKFYSTMSQAIKQYMADEGVEDLRNSPLNGGDGSDEEWAKANEHWTKFMNKYFKVVKICDEEQGCFTFPYRYFDGTVAEEGHEIRYGRDYVIADGMIIEILLCDNTMAATITVDVNGKKGPNRVGYDIWSLSLFYDGSLDEGGVTPECKRNNNECKFGANPSEIRQNRFSSCSEYSNYGGCFGHFLENNFKFDY